MPADRDHYLRVTATYTDRDGMTAGKETMWGLGRGWSRIAATASTAAAAAAAAPAAAAVVRTPSLNRSRPLPRSAVLENPGPGSAPEWDWPAVGLGV